MKTKHTSNQNKSNSRNANLAAELQARPEKLSSDTTKTPETQPTLIPVDFDKRRANRALPTDKVLQLLQHEAPRFYELAEVVGKWIWIQFQDKQPREVTAVLAQLGFHWNNKRQAWQHPCGHFLTEGAATDPRTRYGSKFPADLKAA